MKNLCLSALACLVLISAMANPGATAISPYVRFDFGGNQLKMAEGNRLIEESEAQFKADGLPADFQTVGPGYGPSGAVGLWVLPGLRLGATYSHLRSVRHNLLHVPGQVFFAQDLDFQMREIGAEAAVRISRLAGLTVGANLAKGRAEMIEGFSIEDGGGAFYQDAIASGTKTTYGAFIGLDQTNETGLAGYVQVGYQFRDMGSMPSQLHLSDGTNTADLTGNTIPLDYSGLYVKAGIGFDLVR